MKYLAQIVEVSTDFEFILKIKIKIKNEILEVFSSSIPTLIDFEKSYLVSLEAIIFNDYFVQESNSIPEIKQINNSLQYEITGYLRYGKIESKGIIFEDEILNREFFYLDYFLVKWTVDRICVDFDV